MRPLLLVVTLLVAGCLGGPDAAPGTPGDRNASVTTTPTTPTGDDADQGPVGPRGAVEVERYLFTAERGLVVDHDLAAPMPAAMVPERLAATSFWTSASAPPEIAPWIAEPDADAFDVIGDVEIVVVFSSAQAAVSTIPKATGLAPLGGWFGTAERRAFFVLAADAPDSLEAGRAYSVRLVAKAPPTGFFVPPGDPLAVHLFLSYQSADGSTARYHVGGDQPSTVTISHAHYEVRAPTATTVLEKTGETGPSASFSGEDNPQPLDIAFTVPADAVYVVATVEGTAKAGSIDVDLHVRRGSDGLGSGTSPGARESVILGPAALEGGRDLVAHIVSATGAGATVRLVVTAYGP